MARPRGGPGWLAAIAVLLAPALLAPASAQDDDGLAMSPERFTVTQAQAGEAYLLTVLLQNRRGFDDTIEVALEGGVGAWATTTPAGPFGIAAGQDREVLVRVEVPSSAGPGSNEGIIRFTGQASTGPSGSGASVRPSLGLLLDFTVGGQAVTSVAFLSARVEDAAVGNPVHAFVVARNTGNVRATAEASGQVLPFAEDAPVLSQASGSRVLVPGEEAEVPVTFPAGLAIGQYRARLMANGLETTLPFKVTPVGAVAPDGELHSIVGPARSAAGRPLRLDAWFENTGPVAIGKATFHGEVRDGDELVATLQSDALVVPPGASVNLTAYWTPDRAGTYLVSGHVTYDGYQTVAKETPLTITAKAAAWYDWWWILLVIVIVLSIIAIFWAWRKGRRDRREAERR